MDLKTECSTEIVIIVKYAYMANEREIFSFNLLTEQASVEAKSFKHSLHYWVYLSLVAVLFLDTAVSTSYAVSPLTKFLYLEVGKLNQL